MDKKPDRVFVRFVVFGSMVHCIEVDRKRMRYSAKIIIGVDRLVMAQSHLQNSPIMLPGINKGLNNFAGITVAVSNGSDFTTLRGAFCSLRRDFEIHRMANSLSIVAGSHSFLSVNSLPKRDNA